MPLSSSNGLRLATANRCEHDISRHVIALTAQAIKHPGTHRGPPGNTCAGVHHGVRRIMINLFGLQRINDADVVSQCADMWKHIAQQLSGFAMRSERMLGRQTFEFSSLELRNLTSFGEGFRHWPAIHFRKLRLVVQRFQMRRPPCHTQMDHPTNSLCAVQRLHDSIPPRHRNIRSVDCLCSIHDRVKRRSANTGGPPLQKRTATGICSDCLDRIHD